MLKDSVANTAPFLHADKRIYTFLLNISTVRHDDHYDRKLCTATE